MIPSNEETTVVDVYGANMRACADCAAGGPPEEELVEGLRVGLAQKFGDRVRVDYHSLLDPSVRETYAAFLAQARELGVPLPLVTVDGTLLQGGGIDYRHIVTALEVKVEAGENAVQ